MARPVQLTIQVIGIDKLVKEIAGIRRRLQNPTPAYRVSANLLEKHVAGVFRTEGGRHGRKWKALAPSTVLARDKGWGYYRATPGFSASSTGPVLTWTGGLRRSFTRRGGDHVRAISVSGLTWGSSHPVGSFHHSPGARVGNLPRRAILEFVNDFQEREILVRPLQLYLQGVPPGVIETLIGARIGVGP